MQRRTFLALAGAANAAPAITIRKSAHEMGKRNQELLELAYIGLANAPQWKLADFGSAHKQVCLGGASVNVHKQVWFLPWHRAFIRFHEETLRAALPADRVSDQERAEFALPYWEWDKPEFRTIPDAFTRPMSLIDPAKPNPLFRQNLRNNNDPVSLDGHSVKAIWASHTFFDNDFHPAPIRSNHPELRATLGNLHAAIHQHAGRSDFKSLATAAQDPLFYAHHANVDRLWWSWQEQRTPLHADGEIYARALVDPNGVPNHPLTTVHGGNWQPDLLRSVATKNQPYQYDRLPNIGQALEPIALGAEAGVLAEAPLAKNKEKVLGLEVRNLPEAEGPEEVTLNADEVEPLTIGTAGLVAGVHVKDATFEVKGSDLARFAGKRVTVQLKGKDTGSAKDLILLAPKL